MVKLCKTLTCICKNIHMYIHTRDHALGLLANLFIHQMLNKNETFFPRNFPLCKWYWSIRTFIADKIYTMHKCLTIMSNEYMSRETMVKYITCLYTYRCIVNGVS